jgi:hypothetical protein
MGAQPVPPPRAMENRGGLKHFMQTIQNWISSASAWVQANPTDVVYIGALIGAFVILGGSSGGGRRR